jgi:hypothetical protein
MARMKLTEIDECDRQLIFDHNTCGNLAAGNIAKYAVSLRRAIHRA